MDFDIKPTTTNVEQLKTYVEKLPSESPYVWLVKYEQRLVDNKKTVRALARICNSDQHMLVNKLEGLTKENWLMVSNLTGFEDIPDNYFDIVLWSDCDLESELRQVLKIYSKLKYGGRIYFDNLLDTFGTILTKCLGKHDLQILLGQKLSKTYENSAAFGHIVRLIMEYIFAVVKKDYTVKLIKHGDKQYIVLVKGSIKFHPDAELAAELANVDTAVGKKFPVEKTVQLSAERIRLAAAPLQTLLQR